MCTVGSRIPKWIWQELPKPAKLVLLANRKVDIDDEGHPRVNDDRLAELLTSLELALGEVVDPTMVAADGVELLDTARAYAFGAAGEEDVLMAARDFAFAERTREARDSEVPR